MTKLNWSLAQVVAITVFFLLAVAYYAFFAPFLGNNALEYVAIAVYSVLVVTPLSLSRHQCLSVLCKDDLISLSGGMLWQALAVFTLYVRCTAIDPADPGILLEADNASAYRSHHELDVPG